MLLSETPLKCYQTGTGAPSQLSAALCFSAGDPDESDKRVPLRPWEMHIAWWRDAANLLQHMYDAIRMNGFKLWWYSLAHPWCGSTLAATECLLQLQGWPLSPPRISAGKYWFFWHDYTSSACTFSYCSRTEWVTGQEDGKSYWSSWGQRKFMSLELAPWIKTNSQPLGLE